MKSGMELPRLIALTILMVIYLCVGAAVFNAIEGRNEKMRKERLEEKIDNFMENNTCVSRAELHRLLFVASRDGELVYYILHNKTHLDRWDFSGAFGFSISVVTTIGFGNLAPHTMEGKVLVVIYALVGIPLMLLLLAGIGEKLVLFVKRINKINFCSRKRPQVNRAINMVIISLLGLLVGFIAPATMFHLIEDWHFLEALYFCFTTLSTIGFGDYIIGAHQSVAGIHETRITEGAWHETYEVVAYVWILFGLAYVSLVIKYISDLLLIKASKMEERTVRRLEGTRLFRKVSRENTPTTEEASLHKNSAEEGEDLRSLDPEVDFRGQSIMGESPPPTYSIQRLGKASVRGSAGDSPHTSTATTTTTTSSSSSSSSSRSEQARLHSDSGLYLDMTNSSVVELLSVNYI